MFKPLRPLLFIAFIALIIWPANYLLHVYSSAASNEHSELVSSDKFLMSLQGRTPDGCVALAHMKSVDIIVVGSSHAYADIDPFVLAQQFKGQDVGICALSSWNTDFFVHFIQFLEDQHLAPKRIIWLADEGSLRLLASHEQRITYTKAVFFDAAMRQKTSDKWTASPKNDKLAFVRSRENYADKLAVHSAYLDGLSPVMVSNVLTRVELPNIAVFREGMERAKSNPRNKKNLRRLCADLSQRAIRLDVVMSPVPAQTNELFSSAGETTTYLRTNLTCARRVIDKPLTDWGLDQRHFINRRLRDDYPYEMWESFEAFSLAYEGLTDRQKKRLYDLDHMNGVGAAIFTKEMSKALQ